MNISKEMIFAAFANPDYVETPDVSHDMGRFSLARWVLPRLVESQHLLGLTVVTFEDRWVLHGLSTIRPDDLAHNYPLFVAKAEIPHPDLLRILCRATERTDFSILLHASLDFVKAVAESWIAIAADEVEPFVDDGRWEAIRHALAHERSGAVLGVCGEGSIICQLATFGKGS